MAPYPKPHPAFNPGDGGDEAEAGYIRTIDGHDPYQGGTEGANVHHAGDGFGDDERVGLPVEDVD